MKGTVRELEATYIALSQQQNGPDAASHEMDLPRDAVRRSHVRIAHQMRGLRNQNVALRQALHDKDVFSATLQTLLNDIHVSLHANTHFQLQQH